LNEPTETNTGNGWSLIRDHGPRRRTGGVFRGNGGHALAGLPGCVQPMPALLAGLTNAGHPYQCGCLALGTRIGARIAFQGRMVVDPRLGTNHPAEVGAGSDRPVMRACRSGSEYSDWKERNQARRAIGIVPDHSSRTCSDLAIPSVQIIPQPCGLGRILFSECATFCYFVLATLKRDSRIRDWFPRSRVRDTPCWIRRQPSPSRLAISLML